MAAGIPTATEIKINSRITGNRIAGERCDARIHHKRTVASEAHVPGPSGNRPAPKNVATRVAQRGAVEAGPAGLVGLLEGFMWIVGIAGLGIVQGRGDDISSAGPFPKVDQAATLAAEGKLRIAG